jgi:RHS repeat-associated protein
MIAAPELKPTRHARRTAHVVTKRFFAQGFQIISGGTTTNYFYNRDHLGSIREVLDSSGNVVARYDYDAYGRATLVYGTNIADFQYAGMYIHAATGLNFTLYRVYNANTGRWLSRDPLDDAEMSQGPNLYEYVQNDPIDETDPLGLAGGGRGNRSPPLQCPCHYHQATVWTMAGWQAANSAATGGMYNTLAGLGLGYAATGAMGTGAQTAAKAFGPWYLMVRAGIALDTAVAGFKIVCVHD